MSAKQKTTMLITGKKFSKPAMSRVINGDTVLETNEEKPEKFRLDHLLVEQYPEYNRSTLQNFIKQGYVTVDKNPAKKPNEKYEKSAKITLNLPEIDQSLPEIPVIYEDENVKVLDKPAGLLSMAKGEYCPEPTLEDYGLLVHRLDRDTSGVVILAKNQKTQKMLRKQFQDRKTKKTYYAVVVGHPKNPEALIDLPIIRNYKRPNTFLVDPSGKPSETYYKVIQQNDKYSLLELKPKTGRTHQLRVHLKYLGTPILGDPVYGDDKAQKGGAAENTSSRSAFSYEKRGATSPATAGARSVPRKGISAAPSSSRLFLHAAELEITIPDGNRKVFKSPVPETFYKITLRKP